MAPFADGTPLASQWPIPPGHFFDYEIATELEDAGTYFYHSHVEMQAMSCAGPLIVDDCGSAPFQYDDERIFQFQDHFQKTDREMAHDLGALPFVWPGETAGVVLNGRGVATGQTAAVGPARGSGGYFGSRLRRPSRGRYARALDSTDPSPDSAPEEPDDADASRMQVKPSTRCTLPVIDVEPGKTYRFRFIGATGLSFLTLGFEGHDNLTIIQADGHDYNAPVTTDHLQLGAGQRFDVLFNTKPADGLREDGSRSVYFLQFETLDRPNPYRGYGVLRYDPDAEVPAPPSNPVLNLSADHTSWLEYTLQPLQPERNQAPSAEEVTRRVVIDCEQKLDNKTGRVIWELGHLSWTEYSYQRPMLVDIYQRGEAALPDYDSALRNHGWDPATMSFPAKVGEVLEIVLQNTGSQVEAVEGFVETHPFHAHGKHYYDIGSGPGKYDADANNAKLARLGYRPVQRDTTMLFRYQERVAPGAPAGWRAWRMRVTDAGVWMVHCHLLAHMMMGECWRGICDGIAENDHAWLTRLLPHRYAKHLGCRRRRPDHQDPADGEPGLLRLRRKRVRERHARAHHVPLL